MPKNESTKEESSVYAKTVPAAPGLRAWVRLGAVAAASALAGGLAAAWFYRKTLNSLREAESNGAHSQAEIPDNGTEDV